MRIPEESIDIRRSVADVFAFVADTTNDPKWHTTVVEGRRVSAGPVALGTVFEGVYDSKKRSLETPPHPGNFQTVRATIAEYAPGRALRLRVEFTDPPRGIGARVLGRTFDLTFRFEPLSDGTRVFRGGELQPMALLRPILPLFRRLTASRNRYLLGNLRRVLET
jgi:hypothetical protein